MLATSFELTIKELCEEILSEPNPQALPDKIIDHVQHTFPVEWSTLWVTEQKGATGKKQLRLAAAAGKAKRLMKADNGKPAVYEFGEGLTGVIAQRCTTVNIKEPADFKQYQHARKYDRVMYDRDSAGELCRCVLGVPLLLKSKSFESSSTTDEWRVIGVLKLENVNATDNHPKQFFTEADERIVEGYAAVIAVALEKAQMQADSIRIGQGLLEISKDLLSKLGEPPDLDLIAEQTANVISAESCALWLRDGMNLFLKAESGYPGGKQQAKPYQLEVRGDAPYKVEENPLTSIEWERRKYNKCGLTVFVANTQRPLNLKTAADVKGHFAWKGANDQTMWNKPHGQACYSLVAIPLIDEETQDLKGVFKIENKKPTIFQLESYFTEEDQSLLTTLGNTISLSLLISERFERLSRLEKLISNLRVLDGLDEALFFLLTGLTHGDGLQYNRAIAFLRDEKDPRRLVCQLAIGHMTLEDWAFDMQDISPSESLDFDKLIQSYETEKDRFVLTRIMEYWRDKEVWNDDHRQFLGARAKEQEETKKYISGDLGPDDMLKDFALGDFVLIPIRIEKEYLGVIYADNRFTGNRINEFECHVLDLFAGMAGAVIQASEVPQKLREESQQAWRTFSQPAAHRLGTEAKIIADATTQTLERHLKEKMVRVNGDSLVSLDMVKECLTPVKQSVERLKQAAWVYRQFTPEPEESQEFDVCELIAETIESTTNVVSPLRVETQFPDGSVMLLGRRQRLKYVFEELILNALKEAKDKESALGSDADSEVKMIFQVHKEGTSIQCIVCDNGRGILENLIVRLFNQPVRGRQGGTGLGMFLINRILRENHGRIELHQEKPEGFTGACFLITLPGSGTTVSSISYKPKPKNVPEAPDQVPARMLEGSGFSVLVVEDTAPLRRTLCDLLRENGMTVMEARNEYEAIGKVFSETYSAIVADIDLSEEGGQVNGGFVLVDLLRQSGQKIPIILISQTPPLHDQKKEELNVHAVLDRLLDSFDGDLLRELATVLQENAESKGA